MVFCNQTIGVMMVNRLGGNLYDGNEKYEKMLDIENSVIVISGLVPWCIASSVPLSTMGVSAAALPLAFYLWILPVCHVLQRKAEGSANRASQGKA